MVCVPLRHDGPLVPEQLLDLVQIDPGLYQPRGEGVSQIMKMKVLHLRFAQGQSKGTAQMA
jgi:hypothetical protein